MRQILRIRYFGIIVILIAVSSCLQVENAEQTKILVTYDGIPEVSIGDTLRHIISGSTNYIVESKDIISEYGTEFKRLILKKGNEEIAFINYNEDSLDWGIVTQIVCTHPRCSTKDDLAIGMNMSDLARIYSIEDSKLKGGKNSSIGFFIPDELKKKNYFLTLGKVVVKVMENKEDTIVTALIVAAS